MSSRTGPKCMAALATAAVLALAPVGCGSASRQTPRVAIPSWLVAQARTIGRGERFHPPATGTLLGRCRAAIGPRIAAHVELFAANQVVLVGAGIGTRPPRARSAGRIVAARCYGAIVTLDPTGVVLARPGPQATLGGLFDSWGQPLSRTRLASFRVAPGTHVAVFIDGRAWNGAPASVPLTEHAEIVLEVGPYVPPHRFYTFPPLP